MTKSALVLEDSATQTIIIGKMLQHAGYLPVHASDQAAALAMLKTRGFDLLVLDVFVGGDNTLDHLDTYRALAPKTPIAIMTAGRRDDPLAASSALNKARRARADFLLPKPFHFDDIAQICADADRLNSERGNSTSQVFL